MLKKLVLFMLVFALVCALLVSCTRNGRDDMSQDVSKDHSRPPVTSRPDTTSRTESEESGYDNASIGDASDGIIDDIVSGTEDAVSNVTDGVKDAFDGK